MHKFFEFVDEPRDTIFVVMKLIIWQRLIVLRASHVISYTKYPMMLRSLDHYPSSPRCIPDRCRW